MLLQKQSGLTTEEKNALIQANREIDKLEQKIEISLENIIKYGNDTLTTEEQSKFNIIIAAIHRCRKLPFHRGLCVEMQAALGEIKKLLWYEKLSKRVSRVAKSSAWGTSPNKYKLDTKLEEINKFYEIKEQAVQDAIDDIEKGFNLIDALRERQ